MKPESPQENYTGPPHGLDCLAVHASEARCFCARRDWLREEVPRHQARAELLTQLAGWAHEQGVFARADLEREKPGLGAPGWAWAGVRAAAIMADEVYAGVRRRGLAMRRECEEAAQLALSGAEDAEVEECDAIETARVEEALL